MFKLIIGLGNPGIKYQKSRHNCGFILADFLVKDNDGNWSYEKDFNAEIAKLPKYIVAKPQTFMNDSGSSVSKLVSFYKLSLDEILVIHDDVDLEIGDFKFGKSMGSAGHHGVEDLILKLGSKDFWRFRVGVGRPKDNKFDVEDYVLLNMNPEELNIISSIYPQLLEKVQNL